MTTTNMNRGGVNSIQMTLNITKLKLAISSLQNQIAAQQAIYVKQQQQGQHGGMGNTGGSTSTSNDYLRGVQHGDSINALQGTFSEMSMNKVSCLVGINFASERFVNENHFFCSFSYKIKDSKLLRLHSLD